MKIAVVGMGYVGLVTGVCLSDIGHTVTCIDINLKKVKKMKQGISPIYEPGIAEMMVKNIENDRLIFTTNHKLGVLDADVIYIAVGTPENEDGSANLSCVEHVAKKIAQTIEKDTIVATKSTVPVGTNEKIKQIINDNLVDEFSVEVVSNPDFLREGSAIYDSFHGDRIVIGSESLRAAKVIEKINQPFGVPVFHTDIRSAEMIKYASNAFLATKISFINEISNLCEKVNANVEDVAKGMGLDRRIGSEFLNAGIGYGGSCFPKDLKALIQLASSCDYQFEVLQGVVNVNKKQQVLLVNKLVERLPTLKGKKITVLGLAFKPNTDDMREATSLVVIEKLLENGAEVVAYDPVAITNAKAILGNKVQYIEDIDQAVKNSDATLILTEWDEIKNIRLNSFKTMNYPLVIDGRNCFKLEKMKEHQIEYHSVGRPVVGEVKELIEK
ncbi:UDP-glucose dehydrogenase family protein [Aquibacillus saliphilus]|uniref:UDP-glucose dehydrogenase family protein n=1 Tax=Aquibacillus saliphilus TaxID=1909422 RepID=UPI001CF02B43|nr:UDP-glucose/GDP-mannose dehydrogenase family protein [Aquibacillus saliphilus]